MISRILKTEIVISSLPSGAESLFLSGKRQEISLSR